MNAMQMKVGNEFLAFVWAIARRWVFWMSGPISLAIYFIERASYRVFPTSIYWIVAILCFLGSCFLAWRDEYRLRPSIFAELQDFIKTGHSCYVTPRVPQVPDELFQPLSVTRQLLTLRVNRNQGKTSVPLQRIKEFLPAAGYRTLILDGRLQWLTRQKQWQFLPQPAQSEYGVAKTMGIQDPRVQAIKARVEEDGFELRWSRVENVATLLGNNWQVVYDDDGMYMSADDPGSKMILMARKA